MASVKLPLLVKSFANYYESVMIEIKKSSIKDAGMGVWSTANIPKDTYLTEYFGEVISPTSSEIARNDAVLIIGDGSYLVGAKKYDDTTKCGQIINDYSLPRSTSHEDYLAYKETSKLCNVYFVFDDIVKVYSHRDIANGEELFFHYGYNYWIKVILNSSSEQDRADFFKFNMSSLISNRIKYEKLYKKS